MYGTSPRCRRRRSACSCVVQVRRSARSVTARSAWLRGCRDRCMRLANRGPSREPMAYYPDLSDYAYLASAIRHPATRNIGWLAREPPFATAPPGDALLDALWRYCQISVAQTRGVHDCELCRASAFRAERHGDSLLLGASEIRVFAGTGEIFAAPTLIYHYVEIHHYAPPEPFLRALHDALPPPDPAYFARLDQLGLAWNTT